MFGSYLGIIIYGSQALGGAARVWDINYQASRVELFTLDPDPRQHNCNAHQSEGWVEIFKYYLQMQIVGAFFAF